MLFYTVSIMSTSKVTIRQDDCDKQFAMYSKCYPLLLGYEPAGLTVHPPPPNDRG